MGSGDLVLNFNKAENDKYLTGNPQITFFKKVYRRHTNFFKQIKEIDSTGVSFSFGQETTFNVSQNRKGDLLGKMFLEVDIQYTSTNEDEFSIDHFGNSLVKSIQFIINGQIIDTHTSQWLQVSRELTSNKNEKIVNYEDISTGPKGGKNIPDFKPGIGFGRKYWSYDLNKINIIDRTYGDSPLVFSGAHSNDGLNLNYNTGSTQLNEIRIKKMYIPFNFSFNKYPGLALPLISLNNSDIQFKILLEERDILKGNLSGDLTLLNCKLFGEYIHLDQQEKQLFVNNSHEYLIEQVQKTDIDNPDNSISIEENEFLLKTEVNGFRHPVKYLCWCIANPGIAGNNKGQGPNYFISLCSNNQHGSDGQDGSFNLFLDNQKVFENSDKGMPMSYFTRFLPLKYCNCNIPDLDRIGLYSFAFNPFDIEPSGTCNFSRISNKEIHFRFGNTYFDNIYKDSNGNGSFNDNKLYIFSVSYNVLVINNGSASLKFSS